MARERPLVVVSHGEASLWLNETRRNQMFKVWHGKRPKKFPSLAEARAYAQLVFERTGNIVAITQ